ncbi:amino acid/polyamine transporter I [Endogone sp. FLAS-F59071]|nr:amino acid/polyamine transporter I [Endogone sp. FLAS-F59071]|eukprot:RUS16494.1 amino acid/polyamine transporter I [Endogone sp. FLAS-F59071]
MSKQTREDINQADETRLNQLGYRQELRRELTTFTNYGIALSIVCICSGLTSLFYYGLTTGGPVVMTWGWVVVSFFTAIVGLAMAEICSAYPTSGGLYFWSARLTPPHLKPFASWMTGWFNLVGQFAVTAGIDFGLALMVGATISVGTNFAFTPTPGIIIVIHIAICISHGLANSLGPKMMRAITWLSMKAPTRQPASFVFGDYENATGWTSNGYVILIALLQAQYTLTGYDASAHMTEETRNAQIAGPVGMILAILVSAITGFIFIIGFLFCIQDLPTTINTSTGFPVTQIMVDCVGNSGAIGLMIVAMGACWFCGFASVTANSRMIYAFSRDGAIPGSKLWHTINHKLDTPLNAVWLAVTVAACLALPYLGNTTAYSAVTSIATIGLYLSYGAPILCKLLYPARFKAGPFHLGRLSPIIGWTGVIWILFITILFVLPELNPVTPANMNYAIVAVGAVIFGASGSWFLWARKWFKGPVINLTAEELAQIQLDTDPTIVAGEFRSNEKISTQEYSFRPHEALGKSNDI